MTFRINAEMFAEFGEGHRSRLAFLSSRSGQILPVSSVSNSFSENAGSRKISADQTYHGGQIFASSFRLTHSRRSRCRKRKLWLSAGRAHPEFAGAFFSPFRASAFVRRIAAAVCDSSKIFRRRMRRFITATTTLPRFSFGKSATFKPPTFVRLVRFRCWRRRVESFALRNRRVAFIIFDHRRDFRVVDFTHFGAVGFFRRDELPTVRFDCFR